MSLSYCSCEGPARPPAAVIVDFVSFVWQSLWPSFGKSIKKLSASLSGGVKVTLVGSRFSGRSKHLMTQYSVSFDVFQLYSHTEFLSSDPLIKKKTDKITMADFFSGRQSQ